MLLPLLEELLNRTLALDPDGTAQLAPLEGASLRIVVSGTPVVLTVQVIAARIVIPTALDAVDVTITGTPPALLQLLGSDDQARLLFDGDIRIDGQRHVATRFSKLLAGLDIDWEEQLARLTGDPIAHHTGRLLRQAGHWLAALRDKARQDLPEYLVEEARAVPASDEVQAFADAIDALRDRLARLEQRVQRVTRQRGSQHAAE